MLIADVSGKGMSAALYMAELKGLMLSLSQIHLSPRDLLISANRLISMHLDSRSFITMTYAVIDPAAGVMTYARAGHTPLHATCRPANGDRQPGEHPRAGRPGAGPAHRRRRALRAACSTEVTPPHSPGRPAACCSPTASARR
ncbi:MAG: serine/threonine-protein phosphatase [Comamonadaceae bacterium]|nr:serine/threonine-protein phosphatase [Comamonadaceae bacterium]